MFRLRGVFCLSEPRSRLPGGVRHALVGIRPVLGVGMSRMTVDVTAVVQSAVTGLGFELVDIERAGGGLLRVYIDHPSGISVDQCATVSHQISRVLAVENVDYARLEVSSPGLDRPLKTLADFERFLGHKARVRLNRAVDERKRFDGVIEAVLGESVQFLLLEATDTPRQAIARKRRPAVAESVPEKRIAVSLDVIERARLIPEF